MSTEKSIKFIKNILDCLPNNGKMGRHNFIEISDFICYNIIARINSELNFP